MHIFPLMSLVGDDGLPEIEHKAKIRTAAGAKRYGQPIGSEIVKDAPTRKLKRVAKTAVDAAKDELLAPSEKRPAPAVKATGERWQNRARKASDVWVGDKHDGKLISAVKRVSDKQVKLVYADGSESEPYDNLQSIRVARMNLAVRNAGKQNVRRNDGKFMDSQNKPLKVGDRVRHLDSDAVLVIQSIRDDGTISTLNDAADIRDIQNLEVRHPSNTLQFLRRGNRLNIDNRGQNYLRYFNAYVPDPKVDSLFTFQPTRTFSEGRYRVAINRNSFEIVKRVGSGRGRWEMMRSGRAKIKQGDSHSEQNTARQAFLAFQEVQQDVGARRRNPNLSEEELAAERGKDGNLNINQRNVDISPEQMEALDKAKRKPRILVRAEIKLPRKASPASTSVLDAVKEVFDKLPDPKPFSFNEAGTSMLIHNYDKTLRAIRPMKFDDPQSKRFHTRMVEGINKSRTEPEARFF